MTHQQPHGIGHHQHMPAPYQPQAQMPQPYGYAGIRPSTAAEADVPSTAEI
ncbi:hypothetical protein Sme01_45540 [Sphaerisporangium melleum]|uniref:Uncharacterized protein n=1 Tax=Sphaerisporangium melleum TaxID=321316 RepID=A0A917R0U3_9ACTN|nr:hypothetical protein [Sphaerisporangium melleum]GGK80158.1 hypothetical protein GCM10007964_23540 [Sphaerisporangium melleum]GII72078.1 hypothetical protein Sme01_45540 [Sphaerisporangium melleum]